MVNKVILIGNLGRDPELRYTKNGKSVVNFSVATSEKRGDEEKTQWHNVTVWGNSAEACAKYLTKGSKVFVEGRIDYRTYQDKDGNERKATDIVAFSVQFLSSKKDTTNSGADSERPRRQESIPADEDMPF